MIDEKTTEKTEEKIPEAPEAVSTAVSQVSPETVSENATETEPAVTSESVSEEAPKAEAQPEKKPVSRLTKEEEEARLAELYYAEEYRRKIRAEKEKEEYAEPTEEERLEMEARAKERLEEELSRQAEIDAEKEKEKTRAKSKEEKVRDILTRVSRAVTSASKESGELVEAQTEAIDEPSSVDENTESTEGTGNADEIAEAPEKDDDACVAEDNEAIEEKVVTEVAEAKDEPQVSTEPVTDKTEGSEALSEEKTEQNASEAAEVSSCDEGEKAEEPAPVQEEASVPVSAEEPVPVSTEETVQAPTEEPVKETTSDGSIKVDGFFVNHILHIEGMEVANLTVDITTDVREEAPSISLQNAASEAAPESMTVSEPKEEVESEPAVIGVIKSNENFALDESFDGESDTVSFIPFGEGIKPDNAEGKEQGGVIKGEGEYRTTEPEVSGVIKAKGQSYTLKAIPSVEEAEATGVIKAKGQPYSLEPTPVGAVGVTFKPYYPEDIGVGEDDEADYLSHGDGTELSEKELRRLREEEYRRLLLEEKRRRKKPKGTDVPADTRKPAEPAEIDIGDDADYPDEVEIPTEGTAEVPKKKGKRDETEDLLAFVKYNGDRERAIRESEAAKRTSKIPEKDEGETEPYSVDPSELDDYEAQTDTVAPSDTEGEKPGEIDELLRVAGDEREREKARRSKKKPPKKGKDEPKKPKFNLGRIKKVVKEQKAQDTKVIEQRFAYADKVHLLAKENSEMSFSEATGRDKRGKAKADYELKRSKKAAKKAIHLEKMDNDRYYSVLLTDFTKVKLPKGANLDKVLELREKLTELLIKRDEYNERLLELYTGAGKKAKNAGFGARDEVRRKARRKEYKKQLSLEKRLRRFGVMKDYRDRMHTLMDKCVTLSGEIAELAFILHKEKPVGAVKKDAKKALSTKRAELKASRKELARVTKKGFVQADKRKRRKAEYVFGWIGLVLVLAITGVVIWQWEAIMQFIMTLLAAPPAA